MPGLHLSLGIFNRLFELFEEACTRLDLKFACRQDTTTSIGGESFQNYVALHKKLVDLRQQVTLAAKQSVLSQHVRWKDLGLALGLLYPTLKKIETTQREDVNKCMQEMLAAWLSQQDAVAKVGTPSWETLKAALKSIGENMLADSINS